MRNVSPSVLDVEKYLHDQGTKSQLRFVTCGSVDDGKSTLIGRLLYESKLVFEDHLAALVHDSLKLGTQGQDLDFALLVDGLSAEREQGITIDVAYRYFATERRSFVVADAPGHEQYTRNMVTGASTADLALLLVDARHGLLTQTRRHSYLVSLLGIRQVILAVNKLDLMDYSESVFASIAQIYSAFARDIGIDTPLCIPVSALRGDNIVDVSPNTPWYDGPTVLGALESAEVSGERPRDPFRMPVQMVQRPTADFRGLAGMIVSGTVHQGDLVQVQPSGQQSVVERILTLRGDLSSASSGQSVSITLADDLDIARGDLLSEAASPAPMSTQFEAHIVWLGDNDLVPGRAYLMKLGPLTAGVTISRPKYRINVNTSEHTAAKSLSVNEIGVCTIVVDRSIPYQTYGDSRDLGGLIIIDRLTSQTVGAGLLRFALRRASNIQWQAVQVSKADRATQKNQRACVVWFTGLSGAGKSTIANLVEQRLVEHGHHTYLLDGDNVRHGLNQDLGFTEADRVENIRRAAEVAALMVDAGLVVLVSFISPFRAERQLARSLVAQDEFYEVFVDCPLAVTESRDPKGLYLKARRGELANFTGISSPYEAPEHPDVRLDTATVSAGEAADTVLEHLRRTGVIRES